MRPEGLFLEFISFGADANGNPIYEDTMQYAILRREWDTQQRVATS
jgi:[ribosomal protein S5]-alanine N-acetyltransferase